MVKRTKSLLKPVYSWIFGKLTFQRIDRNREALFGEDSILQQVDPVPRCPRTGQVVDKSTPEESCRLSDGSCSELAANGIRVACLREPHCLLQERRAAA